MRLGGSAAIPTAQRSRRTCSACWWTSQRGDREAFTDLAAASLTRLDAVARLILRDPDLAKDAVQNGLVKAWRDLPTLRDPDRFDAWIRRLVVRACLDEARGQRRHRVASTVIDVGVSTVADASAAIADQDQIERAFRWLRPEDRALIVLRHYLDLPMPDIAEVVRIPLGTAKSRLHRAMDELRAALEADARLTPQLTKDAVR